MAENEIRHHPHASGDDMRRQLVALLSCGLVVLPVVGCSPLGSATEPSSDYPASFRAYAPWIGTWVGTNARFQIHLQVDDPNPSCPVPSCKGARELHYTVNFSDASSGYVGSSSATFMSDADALQYQIPDLALGEIQLLLRTEDLTDPVPGAVLYGFRGTAGYQEAAGNIVVKRYQADAVPIGEPVSTESFPITLRKQ